MRNVIFLDIDGVLNFNNDKDLIFNTFSEKRLGYILNIIKNTNCEIVIISSRREYADDRLMIEEAFKPYNVKYLNYRRTHKSRAKEIINYLNDNNDINLYVIIDDNDLGYTEYNIDQTFIDVYRTGLTKEISDYVIEYFLG